MIISRETCSPPEGAKGNLANLAKSYIAIARM